MKKNENDVKVLLHRGRSPLRQSVEVVCELVFQAVPFLRFSAECIFRPISFELEKAMSFLGFPGGIL